MRAVRRLLHEAIGPDHKTTMPPAPVTPAVFQKTIRRQVIPQPAKSLQVRGMDLRQGNHLLRRQDRIAACAQAAVEFAWWSQRGVQCGGGWHEQDFKIVAV